MILFCTVAALLSLRYGTKIPTPLSRQNGDDFVLQTGGIQS